jgi:hypothetical protein
MSSRIQSHQLSNGLYVSGRPDQLQKDKQPTMGSRAVPYTGGDVKKSGELGKMFDIQILDGPGPHPPSLKSSRPSTSGSLRSGSTSGPLSSKHTTSSGPIPRKSSGPIPLQPTGLITSGPLGSSTGRRSGHLDNQQQQFGWGVGSGKAVYGSAVTSLGSGAEVRVGIGVSKAAMWVFVVAVAMGLLVGAFLMVAVKKAVVLVAVGGVLVPVVLVAVWNLVWVKRGLLGFVRRYPDAELRGALDGQYVKVTGVIFTSNLNPLFISYEWNL